MAENLLWWAVLAAGVGVYLFYRRGRKIREAEESESKLKRIEEVVQGFGGFIAAQVDMSPLDIHDESELPYPKREIIQSLLSAIRLSRDDPKLRTPLEHGLLLVAQYQPGVGNSLRDPTATIATKARPMTATSPESMTEAEREETRRLAKELVELSEEQEARRKRFTPMVDEEMRRLTALIPRDRPR
jgi:hypothetical protein